jgi:protocatechuate 3,4-dioxygenase beta subunit
MKRTHTQGLILGLALAGLARGADGGAPESYAGTVVDDQGRPVAGATVDGYSYQSAEGFGYRDREPELTQRTVTDSNGAFAVFSAPGATLVVVKKAGLATAWKTWSARLGDSTDPVVLTAPTALAGVVVDENKQPVAGAEVWVAEAIIGNEYGRAEQENQLFGKPARGCFSAWTAADGRFRIENFPADAHASLAVRLAGKAQRLVGDGFVRLLENQSGEEDIELMVGPAGAVEGKVVVAETGQPLAGVKVKLEPTTSGLYNSEFRETIESGGDGVFHIPDVQPGTYSVMASIPGRPVPDWVVLPENIQVTVVAGETAHDVAVNATQGALAQVSVVMTNEARLLADVAVSSGRSTAYTGINGMAMLRVPAGKNFFFARQDWWSQNRAAELEAGHVNYVWIELIPPPTITGTVRDSSGAPAAGVLVSFLPGEYPDAPDYEEVTTDQNGRYEIILKLSREVLGWDGPINPTNSLLARDLERNLAAIQEFEKIPANLDLDLRPGITLSGSVKDTEGAPVTNASVNLSFLSGNIVAPLLSRPAELNALGSFAFPALPQGRQYFLQQVTTKGYGTAYGEVKAGDAKTNHYEFPTFVLKRADRKLAGQVVGQDGKPVVGATVSFSGQGQRQRPSTKSGSNGRFVFDGVCEGPVTVSANYQSGAGDISANRPVNISGNAPAEGGDTNVVLRLGINLVVYGQNPRPLRRIIGTVRDPSGAPAGGVALLLWPIQGGQQIIGQTDSAGRYEFNWQERGAGDAGYSLMARDAERGLVALQPVAGKTTNLDLSLQEGLTLSTQVRDNDGQAVISAAASATLWGPPIPNSGGRAGRTLAPAKSDEQGRVRLTGLPQGQKYTVRLEAPGHTFASLEVEAEDTKTNLLELPPFVLAVVDREVAGLVLGVDGKPAAGIELTIFSPGMMAKNTTTDPDGHFVFNGVSRGPVNVSLPLVNTSYTGSAQTQGGDTNLVIQLRANPNRIMPGVAVTTSGTVFDDAGAPDAGVFLSAMPMSLNTSIQSDAGGHYQLHWLTRPTSVNSPDKSSLLGRDFEHNLAVIADMDTTTTNLDLHLKPGLLLSGAVQDTDGKPVTNAILQLIPYPPPNLRTSTLNRLPPTNASAQGWFAISALPQGPPYLVTVTAAGYGSNAIPVPANQTQTNQLQLPAIVLKPANRQLAGQVIGLDGKPCWGAQMTISGEGQPVGAPVRTDSNGQFVIKQVCEGSLDVRALLPASASNPRYGYVAGFLQAHGGDTNIVVKLGLSNGIPMVVPGGAAPTPANRPLPAPLQP